MPADHNQQHSRRPHYHRGRRGPDRRGGDRRPQPQQNETNRDQLDIEQIMREIRSRISERHGIDLTHQQIQELAARRLEAILDPRSIKPSLMDELRRAAGLPADTPPAESEGELQVTESTLYETSNSFLRAIRRLLNPVLKLFLNPRALGDALSLHSQALKSAAGREALQRRQLSEWNALHFEILRRLVTDVARAEIENQQLTLRVESLAARVDFNERRVRAFEQGQYAARSAGRPADVTSPVLQQSTATPRPELPASETPLENALDGGRRRRRRRRGRRPGGGLPRDAISAPAGTAAEAPPVDLNEGDDFVEDEPIANELDEVTIATTPVSAVGEEEPTSEPREAISVVHPESDVIASSESHNPSSAPDPPDEPEAVPREQS